MLFFTADDGVHGRELWRSSGSGGSGTFLVKDIRPGAETSNPMSLAVVGDRVFFIADDGVHGRELWVSDGTVAGTRLVRDIVPGAEGSVREGLLAHDGFVYFAADDRVHGEELWRSDGTEMGTVLVRDVREGPESSYPSPLAEGPDGSLYYVASYPELADRVLWRSEEGTDAVALDMVGKGGYYDFTALGELLVYVRHEDGPAATVARTGGTPETTYDLRYFSYENVVRQSPGGLSRLGNAVYFAGGSDELGTGAELWRTDGTPAGTVMVKDIVPGPGGSFPSWLEVLRGRLFFAAEGGPAGNELWGSNGTASGTRLFKDLEPGEGGSSPRDLTAIQGWLFFSAETTGHGREVWMSDGTLGGTVRLDDIAPGPTSSSIGEFGDSPYLFIRSGWDVFLVANDGVHGRELWAVPFRPEDQCD